MRQRISAVMATLGKLIREQRLAAGLSRQQLSNESRIPISTVIKIEQDLIQNPRWSTVRALARALGVSLDTFGAAEEPKARDDS